MLGRKKTFHVTFKMPQSSNDISTSSFWSTIFADSTATFFFSNATWSTNDRSGVGVGASAASYVTVAAVAAVAVAGAPPGWDRRAEKSCTCWSIALSTGLIVGTPAAAAPAAGATTAGVAGTCPCTGAGGAAGGSSTPSSGAVAGTVGTSLGNAAFFAANVAASGGLSDTAEAAAAATAALSGIGDVSENMSAMCVASRPGTTPRKAAGLA